jgi:hypothetical protein
VELVAFSIGHAGTTGHKTLDHLTTALFTVRPHVKRARATKGVLDPATDHIAKIHDYYQFKSLLDSLADLA